MKRAILALAFMLPASGETGADDIRPGSPAAKDADRNDGGISALVRAVSEAELRATVRDLVAFRSRAVGQPGNARAADCLHERLKRIPGLRVAPLTGPWRNVIATLAGTDPASRELFIAGAHYDSTAASPDIAPGATDNAAGVAIVLEMARILSQGRFRHPIQFCCWNGEEVGLKGSREYVQRLVNDGHRASLYLNYDSTAFDPQQRRVLDVIANPPAAAAKRLLIGNNRRYRLGFALVEDRHACHGDHTPFREAGFPVINTHQEEHGAHYHTMHDTIEQVSFPYIAGNCQLGISIFANLAGAEPSAVVPVPDPGNPGAPGQAAARAGPEFRDPQSAP